MANPTCVKCGGFEFEVVQISPEDSNVDVMIVHCSSRTAINDKVRSDSAVYDNWNDVDAIRVFHQH